MFVGIDRINGLGDEYTLALTHALRFYYKHDLVVLFVLILNVIFQLVHLIGEKPGLWEKLVVSRKLPLHFFQVSRQVIFSCDLKHSWKVIDTLMRLNLLEHLECWGHICPRYVPFGPRKPRVFLADDSPAKHFLAHLLDHIVLRIECIECDSHGFSVLAHWHGRLGLSQAVLTGCRLLILCCSRLLLSASLNDTFFTRLY